MEFPRPRDGGIPVVTGMTANRRSSREACTCEYIGGNDDIGAGAMSLLGRHPEKGGTLHMKSLEGKGTQGQSRWRRYRWPLLALLPLVAVLSFLYWDFVVQSNFGVVVPGKPYRSGQPGETQLE